MKCANILLVEDDDEISRILIRTLEEQGHHVTRVRTGLQALEVWEEVEFQMILLDLMIPYKSGDEVLRSIRKESNVPIIVISAKSTTQNKVELLMLGADDYIIKPFDLDEIVARIEVHLRRTHGRKNLKDRYTVKNMILDIESKTVTLHGKQVITTSTEYRLLEMLVTHPNKVFSRSNLYDSVWSDGCVENETVVKTHMCNLRAKLHEIDPDEEYIETIWGLGYRLYGK